MSHAFSNLRKTSMFFRYLLVIFCPVIILTAQTRLGMSEDASIEFSKLYQQGKIKEAKKYLESAYEPLKKREGLVTFDTYYYLHLADIARNDIEINGQILDPSTRTGTDDSLREDIVNFGGQSEFYGLKPLYVIANPQDGRIISYFDHPIIRKLKQQKIDSNKRNEETKKAITESKNIVSGLGSLLGGLGKAIAYGVKDAVVNVADSLSKDTPIFPGKYYELTTANMNYTLNLALLNDYEQAASTANSLSKIYEEIGGKLSREQVDYNQSLASNTSEMGADLDVILGTGGAKKDIQFGIGESGERESPSFMGTESPEEFAAKFKIDGSGTTYLNELKKFRNEESNSIANSYELASAYLVSAFATSHIGKNEESLSGPITKDSVIAQDDIRASINKASEFIAKQRYLRRSNSALNRLQTDSDFMNAIASQDSQDIEKTSTLLVVETGSISGIDTAKVTIPYYNRATKMGGAVTIKLPRISEAATIYDVTSLLISPSIEPEGSQITASPSTPRKKNSQARLSTPGKTISLYEVDNLDLMLKKQLSDEMPGRILDAAVSVWLQYEFQKLAYKKIEESKNNETNKTILKLLATGATYAISSGDLDTQMWRTLPSKIFMNQVQLKHGKNTLSMMTPAGLRTVQINLDKGADVIHIRVFPNGMVVKTGNHQTFVMADDANSFVGKGEFGRAVETLKK